MCLDEKMKLVGIIGHHLKKDENYFAKNIFSFLTALYNEYLILKQKTITECCSERLLSCCWEDGHEEKSLSCPFAEKRKHRDRPEFDLQTFVVLSQKQEHQLRQQQHHKQHQVHQQQFR